MGFMWQLLCCKYQPIITSPLAQQLLGKTVMDTLWSEEPSAPLGLVTV